MKPHVKTFLDSRGKAAEEVMMCEWCWNAPIVDVHHIVPKGIGGRKGADDVENLIGLCRECHRKAHASEIPAASLSERTRLIIAFLETRKKLKGLKA